MKGKNHITQLKTDHRHHHQKKHRKVSKRTTPAASQHTTATTGKKSTPPHKLPALNIEGGPDSLAPTPTKGSQQHIIIIIIITPPDTSLSYPLVISGMILDLKHPCKFGRCSILSMDSGRISYCARGWVHQVKSETNDSE
jgi:hypothetical protein